jgi:hypothetical protein
VRLILILIGIGIVVVFFLPVSKEFEDDEDYSQFKDDTWGHPDC